MPINNGWITRFASSGNGTSITARIRYDETKPQPGQPVINDPVEGAALICDNTAAVASQVFLTSADQVKHPISVPPGQTKLSAAQLAAVGITTREQAGSISISSP